MPVTTWAAMRVGSPADACSDTRLNAHAPIEIAMQVRTPASLPCRSRFHPITAPRTPAKIMRAANNSSSLQSILQLFNVLFNQSAVSLPTQTVASAMSNAPVSRTSTEVNHNAHSFRLPKMAWECRAIMIRSPIPMTDKFIFSTIQVSSSTILIHWDSVFRLRLRHGGVRFDIAAAVPIASISSKKGCRR